MDEREKQALIERWLDDTLTSEQKIAFDALVETDPDMARRCDDARSLAAVGEDAAPLVFDAGFEGRVMARIRAQDREAPVTIASLIEQLFPRVTAPAGALAAIFMVGNVNAAAAQTPFIEAMFGLPGPIPDIETLILGGPL